MAFQKDTKYVGRQGNIIAYERHNDYLIRTVPKQAANSKRTAAAFGAAASLAKDLRIMLSPVIPNPKNKPMQNRLTAAMRLFLAESGNDMLNTSQSNSLTGFRFIAGVSLSDYLSFTITIDEYDAGKIRVGIPAIKPAEAIAAPAGTASVQIRVMAVAFHPSKRQNAIGKAQLFDIPYNLALQNAAIVDLDCAAGPGSIMVVAASIAFLSADRTGTAPNQPAAEILRTIGI